MASNPATDAELRAMYPNTYKPTLAAQVGLSSDPRRRAAQIAYGNSPSMWPEETDLAAEAARLEQLVAEVGRTYPNSAGRMCAYEINSSRGRVLTDMIAEEKALDVLRSELAGSSTTE